MTFQIPAGYENFVGNADDLLKQFYSQNSHDGEDIIVYNIFIDKELLNGKNALCELLRLKVAIENEFLYHGVDRYVWHKDNLRLKVIAGNRTIFLQGFTRHGDNLEDEWFIVYLLIEVSKKFPGTYLSVRDSDGQFLLIEAADFLPDLLEPENSQNRVWIRNGKINIVPITVPGNQPDGQINVQGALNYLSYEKKFQNDVYSTEIQKMIDYRTINVYPQRIRQIQHRSICILPENVAKVFHEYPQMISIAIHAFLKHIQDKYSMENKKINKQSKLMALFLNNKSSNQTTHDMTIDQSVCYPILFTRALYSQLTFPTFHPPKPFHNLIKSIKLLKCNELTQAIDIGCRLSYGLELAYQDSLERKKIISKKLDPPELILTASKASNGSKIMDAFLNRNIIVPKANDLDPLQNGDLPTVIANHGICMASQLTHSTRSIHYDDQLFQIIDEVIDSDASIEPLSDSFLPMNKLFTALKESSTSIINTSTLVNCIKNLQINQSNHYFCDWNDIDWDDKWMYMSHEELNKDLNQRTKPDPSPVAKPTPSQPESLQSIIDGMNTFLSGTSDYDGLNIATKMKKKEATTPTHPTGLTEEGLKGLDLDFDKVNQLLNEINLKSNNSIDELTGKDDGIEASGVSREVPLQSYPEEEGDSDDEDEYDDFYEQQEVLQEDNVDESHLSDNDYSIDQYMKEMDQELYQSSTMGQTFEMKPNAEHSDAYSEHIDVEYNMLKNFLEAQETLMTNNPDKMQGPMNSILAYMGMGLKMPLPENSMDETEIEELDSDDEV